MAAAKSGNSYWRTISLPSSFHLGSERKLSCTISGLNKLISFLTSYFLTEGIAQLGPFRFLWLNLQGSELLRLQRNLRSQILPQLVGLTEINIHHVGVKLGSGAAFDFQPRCSKTGRFPVRPVRRDRVQGIGHGEYPCP